MNDVLEELIVVNNFPFFHSQQQKEWEKRILEIKFFYDYFAVEWKRRLLCVRKSAENCLLSIKRREGKSLKGEKTSIAFALFSGAVCEMTLVRRLKSAEPDYEIDYSP